MGTEQSKTTQYTFVSKTDYDNTVNYYENEINKYKKELTILKDSKRYTHIDKFNFTMFNYCPSILIVGDSCTGKTTLCNSIIKHFNKNGIHSGTIINPSEKIIKQYETKHSNIDTYNDCNQDILDSIKEEQVNTFKDKHRSYLIIDDIENICYEYYKFLTENKFYNIPVVIIIKNIDQYNDNELLMKNIDYIFLYDTTYEKEVYEMYGKYFYKSYHDFNCVFNCIVKNNYECLVFDNIKKDTHWYKHT